MPFPEPVASEPAPAADASMRGVRLVGALAGLAMVAIGAWFAIMLFLHLVTAVRDPSVIHQTLDQWETVVRGRLPDMLQPGETADGTVATSDPDAPPRSAAQEFITPRDMAEYILVSARPVAILCLLAVVSLLIRIAVSLIDAGARLLGLAGNEAAVLKRILNELRRSG
jgi:hypothetical protein